MSETGAEEENLLMRDIIDTGIQHSLRMFGKLSSRQWSAFPGKIAKIPASGLKDRFGEVELIRFGGNVVLECGVPFSLLYVFTPDSALNLAHLMAQKFNGPVADISRFQMETVGEATNVLANAFIGVLANTLGMTLLPSIPYVLKAREAELLARATDKLPKIEEAFISNCKLESDHLAMDYTFYMLLSGESLRMLIRYARAA